MSTGNKNYRGKSDNDLGVPRYKGESEQNPQKGAIGVSNKDKVKHTKDNSDGEDRNTTKKQSNSI